MSERDELRRRVGAILETEYPREWVAEDVTGQQYSEWYREKADAVLAEIERTHRVIPVELYERFVRAVRVTEACHNCASGAGIWFDEDELTL
jgi:hypothetical protein